MKRDSAGMEGPPPPVDPGPPRKTPVREGRHTTFVALAGLVAIVAYTEGLKVAISGLAAFLLLRNYVIARIGRRRFEEEEEEEQDS
jgi:hypothetical protein